MIGNEPVSRKFSRQSSALKVRTPQSNLPIKATFIALDSSSAPYWSYVMKLPTDYADRSSLLGSIEDLESHWHKESQDAKIGKLAAFAVVTLLGLALSFI